MATYHVSTAEVLDFKEQPAVIYELKTVHHAAKAKAYPKLRIPSPVHSNEKVYVPPFAVISGVLVFLLAVMLIFSTMQLGQQTRAINELNSQSISLSIANSKLNHEYTAIFTKEKIEEAAKQAGLISPSEKTIIFCDLGLPDSATVYESPSAGENILSQISAQLPDVLNIFHHN